MSSFVDLGGRIAFITGAGQGVGRATALLMAENGAGGIVINDYHLDRAEAVAREVETLGVKALAIAGDVSSLEAVQAAVDTAEARFGRIDILVNNAGNAGPTMAIDNLRPFWETEPAEWDHWMKTNFFGVLNCCRAVVPGMLARKGGRIITMISDAARVGEPHLAVYSGAKAGAAGFMRGLARAVAPSGITANCVALGATRTPGIQTMLDDPENVKKMLRGYLIRRLGEPGDAAAMITFLASDAGAWITGQTYPVNGGYSLAA